MDKPQYTVSVDLGSKSSSFKFIKDPALHAFPVPSMWPADNWFSSQIKQSLSDYQDGTEHSPTFIVLETFDGFRKTIEWKQPGSLPPQIVDKYDEPLDYSKDIWLTPSSVITSTLRFFQRTGMPYIYKESYPHKKEKTNESAAKLAA